MSTLNIIPGAALPEHGAASDRYEQSTEPLSKCPSMDQRDGGDGDETGCKKRDKDQATRTDTSVMDRHG